MALISLPHFGTMDPQDLESYYEAETTLNNSPIQIDLNFESKSIEPNRLETVKAFIENIRIYDMNNKRYMEKDYHDKDAETVKHYLEHHLENLGNEELSDLINIGSRSDDHEKQLLKKLQLIRVGIYPNSADHFAIFDYSIGQNITDYLVAIYTDENGNLDYLSMEH